MPEVNTRSLCFFYGAVFIIIAALGSVPNPLFSPLGIFAINNGHSLILLLTGLFLLLAPLGFAEREGGVMIGTGTAYGVLGFFGIITGKKLMFDFILINEADNFLHIGLALALILSGLIAPKKEGVG